MTDRAQAVSPDELATRRALAALDEMADAWAEEVNLTSMVAAVVGHEAGVEALVKQAFAEGTYRARLAPQTPAAGEGNETLLADAIYRGAMTYATARERAQALLAALSPSPTAGGRGELGSRAVPCQEPQAEQGLAAEWRPQLGERVELRPTYRYAEDWRGQELFVAGVSATPRTGEVNVTISEAWPPRHNGDLTDGFGVDDLWPLAKPTEAGGSIPGRLGNQNPISLPVEEG